MAARKPQHKVTGPKESKPVLLGGRGKKNSKPKQTVTGPGAGDKMKKNPPRAKKASGNGRVASRRRSG